MNKISVAQLLEQHGLTWYGLYRRGGGTKSMCWAWAVGKHLPSTKSAARIIRSLGLPTHYLLTLRTRNSWENSPRAAWGTHTGEAMQAASTTAEITDLIESEGPCCPSCHQKIPKAA